MGDDGASLLAAVERLAGFLREPLTERTVQLEHDLEVATAADAATVADAAGIDGTLLIRLSKVKFG